LSESEKKTGRDFAGSWQRPGKKRRRQKVSPQSLERWAIRHLERYACSAANLRRVLSRRVDRIERAQEETFPEAASWIDATLAELASRDFLDDRKYAIAQVVRMRAGGASSRRIQAALREKGVPREIAIEADAQASGEGGEFRAALQYARRRRLGPFRLDPELRASKRERDLAALGRSGFSYEIASRIVEASDPHSLETASIGPHPVGSQ
jgi:regulatory protein